MPGAVLWTAVPEPPWGAVVSVVAGVAGAAAAGLVASGSHQPTRALYGPLAFSCANVSS